MSRRILDPFVRGTPPGAPVVDFAGDLADGGRRWFTDVRFPARRDDLFASAVEHGAPSSLLEAIRHLPHEWYRLPTDLPDLYAEARKYHASRAE